MRWTGFGVITLVGAGACIACEGNRGKAANDVFLLPPPTGSYPIGSTRLQFDAPERPVVAIVWYPAGDTVGRVAAPYLREAAALEPLAALGRNAAWSELAHREVATHSWLEAPIHTGPDRLPVVLFSHGFVGMPSDFTALSEDLASHGFVVVSIAHTGQSLAVTLADGRQETILGPDQELAPTVRDVLAEWRVEDSVSAVVTGADNPELADTTLRRYLGSIPQSTATMWRWVADTRAVLDRLTVLAAPDSPSLFAGRLDFRRVVAVGHSMGGVTSVAFCARDPRCRAAVNLDGSPQYGDLIDQPSPRPVLMVYGVRPGRVGVSDPIYRRGAEYWRAVVRGAAHLNFGDWHYWRPDLLLGETMGSIEPARATGIVRRVVREFLQAKLNGEATGPVGEPDVEIRRVTP
ncbi:MAG: alpha/beta hydrolase family protein [Gemmatimonadales bacterium]